MRFIIGMCINRIAAREMQVTILDMHQIFFCRLGEVPVQEASVVIAMSSPHRKDVLEAVPFAIDALKADVPIWKKEIYEGDQAPQWKENAECAWSRK